MIKDGEETNQAEIVIIRRRASGEDGGHHGGAWKIAYADFVTAMMTFFLVMWLINSTPSKTLVQIAAYFNPVRLTNKVATTKGLEDAGAGHGPERDVAVTKEKTPQSGAPQLPAAATAEPTREEAMLRQPFAKLDELAERAAREIPDLAGEKKSAEARISNGEAFRDPFDPAFRLEMQQTEAAAPKASQAASEQPAAKQPRAREAPQAAEAPQAPVERAAEAPAKAPSPQERAHAAAPAARAGEASKTEAQRLETEIHEVLRAAPPGTLPHIDVRASDEGVLIAVTDEYDFGMFAVGSAEPRPATVAVMAKIAKILAARPETLIVRGHTDSRPYRNGTYDNWRLSTARAHMAYYMLVRGGIDEKRFERVEGYADHALRVLADPTAAQNRRIEILLRAAKR